MRKFPWFFISVASSLYYAGPGIGCRSVSGYVLIRSLILPPILQRMGAIQYLSGLGICLVFLTACQMNDPNDTLVLFSPNVVTFIRSFLSKSLGRLQMPGGGEEVLIVRFVLRPKPKEVARLLKVDGS